jgi:hypothetical protein
MMNPERYGELFRNGHIRRTPRHGDHVTADPDDGDASHASRTYTLTGARRFAGGRPVSEWTTCHSPSITAPGTSRIV